MSFKAAASELQANPGSQPATSRLTRLQSRSAALVMLIPAAAELAVGGWQLGGPSLWRDEGDTLSVATRPVGAIMALLRHEDVVHGPYYLMMHFVLAVAGTSPVALRLPSLLAAAGAASITAVIGRRLAMASGLPGPTVTGVAAGLLLVLLPETTWYAQDARPYAITMLLAAGATYLLIRGRDDGRARWWAGYGATIAGLGAMNPLALVLLPAHAIALAAVRRQPSDTGRERQVLRAWGWFALASALAIACLLPLLLAVARQSGQFGWIQRPGPAAVTQLVSDFSGRQALEPVSCGLVALCVVMEAISWRRPGCTLGKIALPWLVLPPAVLIGVSLVRTPVYDERYVMFCAPAMALVVAGGLSWLARVLAALPQPYRWVAVAAPAAAAVLTVALVIGPQQWVRQTGARPDNFAKVALLVRAHARPGDAVLYLPQSATVVGQAYPAAFAQLRDIGQGRSPAASATLHGQPASAPELQRRFQSVTRLWVVVLGSRRYWSASLGQVERRLLSGLKLAGTWRVRSVLLSLYVRP